MHVLLDQPQYTSEIFEFINLSLKYGLHINIPNNQNKITYQMYLDISTTSASIKTAHQNHRPIMEKHYLEDTLEVQTTHNTVKKLKI